MLKQPGSRADAPDPSVPASGFDPSRTTTFTMVFECQPDDLKGNPFHIKTPFGYPVSIGRGNAFDQLEEETAGTEWFWRIVDAAGLADLPSDEEAALRLILRRGGYSATLASETEARRAKTQSGLVVDEGSAAKPDAQSLSEEPRS